MKNGPSLRNLLDQVKNFAMPPGAVYGQNAGAIGGAFKE
jgi:hypothetical protein